MDIKFLHSVTELYPTHAEFVKIIDEYLYTIIINVHPDENRHFDVSDKIKVKILHKIAETVSALPRDEYQVVGLAFDQIDQETKDFLHLYNLKNDNFNYNGMMLYSKESKSVFELGQEELVLNDLTLLKDWVYHHSHGFLMTPDNTYKNILTHKNWGLVQFHSSETYSKDDMVKNSLQTFELMAEKFKGKISFTICDIYLEHICKKLFNFFELRAKNLPMIRILYAMEGRSKFHKVFQMSKKA